MAHGKSRSEVETELKIKLSPGDMEKVFQALIETDGTSEVYHKYMPRMYYDTSGLALYQNGISLRVQYKSGKAGVLGGYEQTVKIALAPDSPLEQGVLLRKECKNNIQSHKPDLSSVVDRQAKTALAPFKNKKLMHVFTAAIERRYFDWRLKSGGKKGLVEVAFDVGKIILPHNNAHQDFYEIEVEVKGGGNEFIEIVKNEILRLAPAAKIQPLSKSEQGSLFYLKQKR